MARIPYASPEQYEELMRNIRLPETVWPIHSMLAHTPAIGGSVLRLILTLQADADLEFFLHELVILRVIQYCQAQYAWVQHVTIAKAIGVSDAQIAALEHGHAPASLFSRRERIVLAFTEEVLYAARATDHTFAQLRDELSAREIVELLLTIGYFRMIGGLFSTLDVEPDPAQAIELPELTCEVA